MPSSSSSETPYRQTDFGPALYPEFPLITLFRFAEPLLLLTKGADINVRDAIGDTPLHMAVHTGNKPITELLLKNGANVNAKSVVNLSPLGVASKSGRTDLVDLLKQHGAQE